MTTPNPIAFYGEGWHRYDYDPIERAVRQWLPTGRDVWLHNPWGHREAPMTARQYWLAQADGWKLATDMGRWRAACALMQAHGKGVYIYVGGPHTLDLYEWGDWKQWTENEVATLPGLKGFALDASFGYKAGSKELRDVERLQDAGLNPTLEPTPLKTHEHLYDFDRVMTHRFWAGIAQPKNKWAIKTTGDTYRLLTHERDSVVPALINDCFDKGHIPVVPAHLLKGAA